MLLLKLPKRPSNVRQTIPASSTEIDDLRKDVDDLRELVLVLAKSLSKVKTQAQTNNSNAS